MKWLEDLFWLPMAIFFVIIGIIISVIEDE